MSEEQIDKMTATIIEIGEKTEDNNKKIERLEKKLNAFCMAVLKNIEKEKASKIFKEYQKTSFVNE
jgi:hypothetical protein